MLSPRLRRQIYELYMGLSRDKGEFFEKNKFFLIGCSLYYFVWAFSFSSCPGYLIRV